MDFKKILSDLVKAENISFILSGKPISHDEVFADIGLLPAIARRADQLCSLCLGYGIGATFTEAEDAMLGVKVQFDEVTPNVLRLLCIYDIILDIVNTSYSKEQVVLDELMYD